MCCARVPEARVCLWIRYLHCLSLHALSLSLSLLSLVRMYVCGRVRPQLHHKRRLHVAACARARGGCRGTIPCMCKCTCFRVCLNAQSDVGTSSCLCRRTRKLSGQCAVVYASRLSCRPGRRFGVCFRACGFQVLVYNVRFPRVFEHFLSVVVVRSCFFADFACVAILLFSGPKLEVFCCFFSVFYAGRAVSTAFSRVIRRFFVAVSALSQSIRGFRRFLLLSFYGLFVACCSCTFAEQPCADHDSVQIRLHPFLQSIHVPAMIL